MTPPAPADPAAPERPARRPRHGDARSRRRRWGALLAVVGVVVAGAVVDAAAPESPAAPPVGASDAVAVSAAGSYSSSAFCVGGTGTAAATTIYLTNTTARTVTGDVTSVGPAGSGGAVPTTRRAVTVPALRTAAVDPSEGLPSGSNATTISFSGGGVVVSQAVSGPGGWSTAPCASRVSPQWDFAGGSTASGNLLTLALFDPSAAESVVNVSFLTDAGVVSPQAYQGLVVPPGQLVTENVGDFVQNAGAIGTVVTAQSGALVSTEFQQWAPGGTGGISLCLGTPGLATTWRFAQTTTMSGSTVNFYLANPGPAPASATISFGLASGSVEPRQTVVAPGSVTTFTASSTAGLPHQVPYAVTVSASGPIAVGRSVLAPGGSPAPVWGSSPGTVTAAASWVVPGPGAPGAPGTTGASVRSLAVADPGARRSPSASPVSVRAAPRPG